MGWHGSARDNKGISPNGYGRWLQKLRF